MQNFEYKGTKTVVVKITHRLHYVSTPYRRDRKGQFPKKYSEAVYITFSKVVHKIKLPLTYSEFRVHMQSQLKAGSFVEQKLCYA